MIKQATIVVLLVAGVGIQLFGVLGAARLRAPLDRLHFAAAATTFGPFLIAGAVVVDQALAESGAKALLVAIVLVVGSPIVAHSIARAAWARTVHDLAPGPSADAEMELR
jgi:multicomponent Na+:H+ antiporter subunit G